MVTVKKIQWISKEALEAEVTLTDGTYDISCFSQPFKYSEGDVIEDNLYGFDTNNVVKYYGEEYSIKKFGNGFEHNIIGKVFNKLNKIICIGELLIEIEFIPMDINENEYIEFNCKRIDIY